MSWLCRKNSRCLFLFGLTLGQACTSLAQGPSPTKEYVRLGDRVIAIELLAGPAASIVTSTGTPQSTTINTAFATALQATVKDSNGNPVSGASVTFTAPATGASAKFGTSSTASATSNSSGVATAPALTANSLAGSYTVTATVSGVGTPANFALTNTAGTAASVTATGGTPQSTTINTAFATALQATVKDGGGNPISGASVTFTAPATGVTAKFGTSSTATATSNSSGVATAPTLTANSLAGSYTVTATVSGVGTPANFALTNTAGAAASVTATAGTPQSTPINVSFSTALQATVKDAGANPVSGITVTFTAPSTGASGTFGTSLTATATTNTSGIATAPAFTANGTGGTFSVAATVPGATTASFNLTNTYTVSGTVTYNGAGLAAITILLNNVATVATNSSGNFSIGNLTAGGSYIIAPSNAYYIFSPGSVDVTPLNSNRSLSFTSFPSPSGTYMNPNSGSGTSQNFHFQTTPASSNSIPVELLYNVSSSSAANACYIYTGGGQIRLADNTGTGWLLPAYYFNGLSHLSMQESHNSQCLFDNYNTYWQYANSVFDVYTALYFFAPFGGSKNVYMRVNGGAWLQLGTWGVPNPEVRWATLAVTYPANGATITANTNFNVTGTVSWNGYPAGQVYVYVDGFASSHSPASLNGSNFTFTTQVATGSHKITVVTTSASAPNLIGAVIPLTVTGQ